MITKEQAKLLKHGDLIHSGECRRSVGPRGGVTNHVEVWRVSGQFREVTRGPNKGTWRVPLKYGFRGYGDITHFNYTMWHLESECPLHSVPEGQCYPPKEESNV